MSYRYDDDRAYRSGSTSTGRKGKQGFASMDKEKVRELGIKARAERFNRSFEEESDLEEENRREGKTNHGYGSSRTSDGRRDNGKNSRRYEQDSDEEDTKDHQPYSNRRKGHSKHGGQGFAGNPELGIAARAKRNGRSYDEESDVEEENRNEGRTNHGYGSSRSRNYKSSKSQRRNRDEDESEDDNGEEHLRQDGKPDMRFKTNYESDEEDDDQSSNNRSSRSNNQSSRSYKQSSGKGKQGFASMDPEKQRKIASKGGRTVHAGEAPRSKRDYDDDDRSYSGKNRRYKSEDNDEDMDDDRRRSNGHGKQGFASMDPEKQRKIASKGGRTVHAGEAPRSKKRSRDEDESSGDESGSGPRRQDGRPDKRYKSNQDSDEEDSGDDNSGRNYRRRQDGRPDKRHRGNQGSSSSRSRNYSRDDDESGDDSHRRQDGKPDRRYRENQ